MTQDFLKLLEISASAEGGTAVPMRRSRMRNHGSETVREVLALFSRYCSIANFQCWDQTLVRPADHLLTLDTRQHEKSCMCPDKPAVGRYLTNPGSRVSDESRQEHKTTLEKRFEAERTPTTLQSLKVFVDVYARRKRIRMS